MSVAPPDPAPGVAALVAAVHRALRAGLHTVAVAESLTGGELAAALTGPAGASACVRGGLVVYATDLKARLAGVDPDLLDRVGTVDPDVALALARGARARLAASFGVGVTGVAGPSEQDGRAVGTVFLAVSGPDGERVAERALAGDRAAIRVASVREALTLLLAAATGAAPVTTGTSVPGPDVVTGTWTPSA